MAAATAPLAWGILGPGRIARAFASALATSTPAGSSRSAAAGRKPLTHLPASSRPTGRTGATKRCSRTRRSRRSTSPRRTPARRVGDQGCRGRQAHPLRKADGYEPCRGHGHRRSGQRTTTFSDGSVHVPLPSADRKLVELSARAGHRRRASSSRRLQLPRRLRPQGPALQERARRAAASSTSAATARRWRGWWPAWRAGRTSPSRSRSRLRSHRRDGRRRVGHGGREVPRRDRRDALDRRQPAMESVVRIFGSEGNILIPRPWIPPREGGKTVDHGHSAGQKDPQEIAVDRRAGSTQSRRTPSPPTSPAARRLPRDELGRQAGQHAGARPVARGHRPGLRLGEARRVACTVHRRPLRPQGQHRWHTRKIPGMDRPVWRLVMGWTTRFHAARGRHVRRFLRARRQHLRHRLRLRRRQLRALLGQWVRTAATRQGGGHRTRAPTRQCASRRT